MFFSSPAPSIASMETICSNMMKCDNEYIAVPSLYKLWWSAKLKRSGASMVQGNEKAHGVGEHSRRAAVCDLQLLFRIPALHSGQTFDRGCTKGDTGKAEHAVASRRVQRRFAVIVDEHPKRAPGETIGGSIERPHGVLFVDCFEVGL